VKERFCNHILNDHSLNSLAYRLAGEDKEDLKQELALIVCEKTEQELEKMEGYFNFWCVRVMINITGSCGSFTKIFTQPKLNTEDAIFDQQLEYDHYTDERLNEVDNALQDFHWYKRELFKLYIECGSFRKVEEAVGIDHSSVYKTVTEVKKTIKERI
jgi:hypothetical protein